MTLSTLDHCSIRTVKLAETRDFYVDLLGMVDGERPDFDFPGNWLYVEGKPVVHLVGVDPDDPSGLMEYLGGPATTKFGKIRADRGQEKPWTEVFKAIHIEFGNEAWNNAGAYRFGGFNGSDYWHDLIEQGKKSP